MSEADEKLAVFQAERAPHPELVKHFSSTTAIHGTEPYVYQPYPKTLFALIDGQVSTKVVVSEAEEKALGLEWTDSPLRVGEAAEAAAKPAPPLGPEKPVDPPAPE